mgnify:FL=1
MKRGIAMEYQKKGYLTSYFKLFHLKDVQKIEIKAHYHEFDKIILFLSGKVKYNIEGQTYQLFPYDIVFVPHNCIHYPTISDTATYERIVLYIDPNYLKNKIDTTDKLDFCFNYTQEHNSYVMNLDNINENDILKQIQILENSFNDKGFAHKLYSNLKFLEFMILINRAIINDNKNLTIHHKVSYDKTINSVIDYINEHLFTELNIDYLANHFFVSKYYLMRNFKLKTGYSIHQYILNKRLIVAKEKIKSGIALTQICFDCGFKDYSTFSRTFKQIFKQTPREFKKALNEKTDIYKEAKQYE